MLSVRLQIFLKTLKMDRYSGLHQKEVLIIALRWTNNTEDIVATPEEPV